MSKTVLIVPDRPAAEDFQAASIEVMEGRVDISIGEKLDGSVSMRCLMQAAIEQFKSKGVPDAAIPMVMLTATRFLLIGILAERKRAGNV